jgi:hypothetical protein
MESRASGLRQGGYIDFNLVRIYYISRDWWSLLYIIQLSSLLSPEAVAGGRHQLGNFSLDDVVRHQIQPMSISLLMTSGWRNRLHIFYSAQIPEQEKKLQ